MQKDQKQDAAPNLNELFKFEPKGDAGSAAPAAGGTPSPAAAATADKPADPMQSVLDAVKKDAEKK